MLELETFHPGTILRTVFLEPLSLSTYRLAKEIGVPQTRLSEILKGRRAITADTALRLSKYFGLEDNFWTDVQSAYDLAKQKALIFDELEQIRPYEPERSNQDPN